MFVALAASTINSLPTSSLESINASLQSIALSIQHHSFFDSQAFGVLLGGLIGLIPFLWRVYEDRPRITVHAQADFVFMGGDTQPSQGLSIKIYNSGRRPINVTNVFLRYATGESLVFITDAAFFGKSSLPFKLEERSAHSVTIRAGSIASSVLERNDYPIAACYSDALGKEYCTPLSEKFWDDFFDHKKSSGASAA